MRLHIACALLAALLMSASGALAQQAPSPSPQFTREFQAGVDAYRLGKYDEAREHMQKAIAFEATLPGPYRYLAAIDQSQSKFADCVEHARTAIALNPKSADLPETVKIHDACRASLGKTAYTFAADSTGGAITVTANVEQGSVTLNGLKYGATPLQPREVVAGDAEIGVSKLGYLPQTKTVKVLAGVVTDVDFTLEKDPAYHEANENGGTGKPTEPTTGFLALTGTGAGASVLVDGAASTAPIDKIEASPGVHEIEVRAPGMEPWRRRVRIARGQKIAIDVVLTSADARASSHGKGTAFVTIGALLAAGGLGAGIYSYRQAEIAHDWVRIEQTRPPGVPITESGAALPVHTRADIDAQNDKAKTWGYAADAALGAAVIATGVGVYFLLQDRPEERAGQPPPFAIAPIVGHGETGFVVEKAVQW